MNIKKTIAHAAVLCAAFMASVPMLDAQTIADGEQDSNTKYGVVDFSTSFMRSAPDYESSLDNQMLMGTVVSIHDTDRYWLKVKSPEPYSGWVNEQGIAIMDRTEIEEYLRAPKYIFTGASSYIYKDASLKSEHLSEIVAGNIVRVGMIGNRLSKGQFRVVQLPSGVTGYVRSMYLADFDEWAAENKFTADNVIGWAEKMLGIPYMWGGTSIKNVDCSGLVRTACFMCGVLTPRDASEMIFTGDPVDISGVPQCDFSKIERGDLLFFGNKATGAVTHVALYIGGGRFIHSSQKVKINSLDPSQEDYYANTVRLLGARRIFIPDYEKKGLTPIARSPYYFSK